MCLYPRLLKNRKYTKTKKNKGIIPEVTDKRVLMVPIGCGKCMECRKQKGRQWQIRLQEEIRTDKTGKFVTLTFSNEAIKELKEYVERDTIDNVNKETGEIYVPEGYELDNAIATKGTRLFLERWRKEHGTSVKHWLITELGQGNKGWKGTENLHMHGLIFTDKKDEIIKRWKYGHVFIGSYVTERTVNYCIKYCTKVDELHKEYNPKVLTSAGIGKNYLNRIDAKRNKYVPRETEETYTTRQGIKLNLPIYYRNKIYSEKERESLWLEKLDKQERWVDGVKIDISKGEKIYEEYLITAQKKNKRLGYGDDIIDWDRKEYEKQRRKIMLEKRLTNVKK